MANDSNGDTSFEDFFKEAFGEEPESESQLKTGAPIFADQKVPDDIMATAQQAMLEQGSLEAEEPKDAVSSSHAAEKEEPKVKVEEASPDSGRSIKISTVRYIDDLPKTKIESTEESVEAQPRQTSSVPVANAVPAEPVSEVQSAASILNSDRDKDDTHSFRNEILARLHSETESSPQLAVNPAVTAGTVEQKQPVSSGPAASLTSDTPSLPTKADFLAAANAKPKKMPKQFSTAIDGIDIPPVGETSLPGKVEMNTPIKAEANPQSRPQSRPHGTGKADLSARADGNSRAERSAAFGGEETMRSRSERRQGKNRSNRRPKQHSRQSKVHIGRSIAIILVLVVLALGGLGYFFVQDNLKAVNPKDTTAKTINIPESTSFNKVAEILKKNDLIKNTMVFSVYTKFKGISDFKSGHYSLNRAMTPDQIAKTLEKGGEAASPTEGKITIPEGYTIDQIATAFTVNAGSKKSEKTPFSQEDFLNVVRDPAFIAEMTAKYPQLFAGMPAADSGVKYQLEGYLFPATYDYNDSTTVKSIVEQMIATMNQNLETYYAQLPTLGLDVKTLLSLAALVEKEANAEEDRKNVADVFLKRMNEGWTLGTNVAILYAEGRLGTKITAEDDANLDTTMDSPFNLYQNQGTGPGPIASPSAMSIGAVINHASNPYYYFYADPTTGTLYFAATQAEHDANQAAHNGAAS